MRLIDVDKLLEDIAELKQSPWYNNEYGYVDRKEALEAVRYLCIKKAPIVDAVSREKYEASQAVRKILVEFADDLLAELKERVEVVRCKDCESWQTDWKPKGCEHEDAHFCEMIGRVVCADHYCGYAERKKDK